MSLRRKVVASIAYLLIIWAWWNVMFANLTTRMDIIDIGTDNTTFVATMDAVRAIGPCNENVEQQHYFDDGDFWLFIEITDEAGKPAAQLVAEPGTKIHLNGYTSPENTVFIGLPGGLIQGKTYHLTYKCLNSLGEPIGDLSFRLYGETKKSGWFMCFPFICVSVAGLIAIWGYKRKYAYILLMGAMLFLNIGLMPTLETAEENTAFADVYNASSKLMGKETHDTQGYVYIDEDQIRNGAFNNYLNAVITYWTTIGSERRVTAAHKVSSIYRVSPVKYSLYQLPAVAGVTIARLLRLPFQLTVAFGWIINAVITFSIMTTVGKIGGSNKGGFLDQYYKCLSILPAFLIASMSYTAYGIWIALLIWILVGFYRGVFRNGKGINKTVLLVAAAEIMFVLRRMAFVILAPDTKVTLKEAVKRIILNTSEIVEEIVGYDSFTNASTFVAVMALLVIVFLLKWRTDKYIYRNYHTNELQLIRMMVVGCALLLLLTSACYTNYYGEASDNPLNGFALFAILLVPLRRNVAGEDKLTSCTDTEKTKVNNFDGLYRLTIIVSCLTTLWRYSSI